MSFVFSFVGSVFIALIILLYNIRDMIIILDLWSDVLYYIIIYMIIINFLIEACFLGSNIALCNFMSNYLYYIGIICVQGFKDYHCYILLLYYIIGIL